MTSEAVSMNLADYLVSHGVDPAQAAALGKQGDAISSNRGLGLAESAHPAAQEMLRESVPASSRSALAATDRAQAAELHSHLADVMAPPASGSDYRLPPSFEPQNEEALAADTQLRAALHAEGLPRYLVEGIGQTLAEAASKRSSETAQQATARQAEVRKSLEGFYGRDTAANLRLVDGLLDRLLARGGATADFVRAAAPHLSALDIDSLVQFAKHRATFR